MKYFPLLPLLALTFFANAQASLIVNMTGIGNIKLGMKKADMEKLTGQPIRLGNLLKEDWNFDTVTAKINDADFTLVFERQYTDDKNYDISLREVGSSNTALKTKSGVGIGDDKYKIISTYEGYTIWIVPDYEKDYTVRSKTKTTIYLFGDNTAMSSCFTCS